MTPEADGATTRRGLNQAWALVIAALIGAVSTYLLDYRDSAMLTAARSEIEALKAENAQLRNQISQLPANKPPASPRRRGAPATATTPRDEGPTAEPPRTPAATTTTQPNGLAKNGYTLLLNECRRSLSTVVCSLTVTNDRDIARQTQMIAGSTVFLASNSRPFASSEVMLAEVRNRQWTQVSLLPKRPSPAEVVFENVPTAVADIAQFDFSMWAADTGHFTVSYPADIAIR